MLPEAAGVIQHDAEFFVLKLPPRFEFFKVDAVQRCVVRLEDADASTGLRLNSVEISETLKKRDRSMEPMVPGSRQFAPGIAYNGSFAVAAQLSENVFENLGRRVARIDQELRNPFVGVIEEQQAARRLSVPPGEKAAPVPV